MAKLKFTGSWNEVVGKMKQRYGNLTDSDLIFTEGKEQELLGRLQRKLGMSEQEIRDTIENL